MVAVLANSNHASVYGIHDEILAAMLPNYAARRAEEETKKEEANKKANIGAQEVGKPPFAAVPELTGDWSDSVHTYQGDFPLILSFKPYHDVHVQLGAQPKTLLSEVKFREDRLKGYFVGDIGTEDANRRPYRLHLDLKLRGSAMNGAVLDVTHTDGGEGGAPGKRTGNAVAHWAELPRQETSIP